jgi:hypothetical protein
VNRGTQHVFHPFAEASLALVDSLLGYAAQEFLTAFPFMVGGTVDAMKQIVWEIDLDLGHIARIGRGFG